MGMTAADLALEASEEVRFVDMVLAVGTVVGVAGFVVVAEEVAAAVAWPGLA